MMEDLENILKDLRDSYDKQDDICIELAQKYASQGKKDLEQVNIAKHNVYQRIIKDLGNILDFYF